MAKFAKLFETAHGQLLAFKDFDHEDDQYKLMLRGEGNSFCDPTIGLGYDNEEARNEQFDRMKQEDAEKSAAELAATVRNFFSDEAAA